MAIELAAEQNRSGEAAAELLVGCKKGQLIDLILKYQIPLTFGNLKSGYDLSPVKMLRIMKVMKQFDIIHFHTFNVVVMMAAIFSGKKIVYTIHGNFNYGKKVSTGDRINNLMKKYFLNHQINFITYNSNWCKNEAFKKFNITKTPGKVIYNGLPANEINSRPTVENVLEEKKPEGKFIVGTISRFNKSKRIERLIEGFAIFSKRKQDVMLLLVGDGIERQNLENLVHQLNISSITQFTGYKSETRAFHEKMDVCVFPFENEAFGLVVLESFQLGKPVIVFEDGGGMKEILGDEFAEDIVDSVKLLAGRLENYYQKRRYTEQNLSAERKRIAELFSIQKMNHQMAECYRNLS